MAAKKTKNKTFVIIDGHAIIHRAYHAIPGLTTKDGTIVNAVFGFTSMLLKVYEQLEPDYLAVSFDVAGGTFRDEIYEDYKATRVAADQDLYDQIPLVYDVVEAFNIPIYEKEGFEADDVIGTLAKQMKKKHPGVTTIVATGDGDMLQLVDDGKTQVYLLRRGFSDMKLYDEKAVIEKYGFGPERVVDYKALKGDSSDNIPGVRGIGDKGAKELIEKIGGIADIYKKSNQKKLEELIKASTIKKLQEGKEDAHMSLELATIHTNVTGLRFKLEDCDAYNFELKEVTELVKQFEFYSLLKRIPGNEEENVFEDDKPKKQTKKIKMINVDSSTMVKEFVKHVKTVKEFACKEIISGDDAVSSILTGLVCVVERKSYFIDLSRLNKEETKKIFSLFEESKHLIVGHDLKKLFKALFVLEIDVQAKLFDIMIGSYVLNSSTRAHGLKEILLREIGLELPENDQGTLFGADPAALANELVGIGKIYQKYEREMHKEAVRGLFDDMEMALIPVLADMELNGIALDEKMLKEMSALAHKDIAALVKKIHKEAGQEFNVSSSVQLREILYETLALPTQGIKKGKTGYSTAASELEKLRDMHPIISMIEEYREIEKLRNTYIDVLPTLINKKTGRIHTTFNQTVATTGRLSSSDPNLQNIPIRTELGRKIRDAFVADRGYTLLAADYSQIELRIVASLADDKNLIDIFKKGQDVHKATAALIQGVDLKDVTKDMRSKAKAVNFGVLYGMGAHGLSWRTGLTHYEARDFIDKYFESFAGVKTFLDTLLENAKDDGYVETLFGRKRYIPELSSDNFQIRNAGERMAINMPVQGTAADLMKLAMIEVHKKLKETYSSEEVKMLLQVHDELVLEVKNDLADEVGKLVKKIMEDVTKLDVPIEVHVDTDKRWGKIK